MTPYTLAIVLDPDFGVRLRDVAGHFDLWIVTSQVNRTVVEDLWKEVADSPECHDVSIWTNEFTGMTVEQWRVILEDIEDHHGQYSHDPPVTILEVYGATPADYYGYDKIEPTSDGFRATRKSPS